MRIVIFLLVLANLLFFAWSRGYLGTGDTGAPRVDEPFRADQIRLVSNDRPPDVSPTAPAVPAAPVPSEPASSARETCAALNDLPQADADAVERLFAERLPAFRLSRTDTPASSSYWVHISPFKTRREAESKVAELRNLGVRDYFIQPDGADNFVISLGLFSTQAAAELALAALRNKGVRSARISERPRRPAVSKIEFSGPEAQTGEMRRLIGQALPQAAPGDCAQSAAP
jgi:cell division septation protein DedD